MMKRHGRLGLERLSPNKYRNMQDREEEEKDVLRVLCQSKKSIGTCEQHITHQKSFKVDDGIQENKNIFKKMVKNCK